ncbi:hypothetical protein [Clostridium ljungdahlii]|uniref:Uncharacterized protein n=1 Tax=Clostridium ljungdahlii (strain ATCC 55383 / DSM 13528 / PETC) TaxID=748727 RepID=D8GLN7_CLOLD|nr:hypothetical protein [Clostridium ljungdahlii]ADK13433.1 hypothetical protein CLJU_c03510 [Clostridium ljungdahlii DSM 13528]OAA89052.1 hypothetical protein WX45_02293 [Clostridium ljungdahlii DSM 13528]
MKKIKILVTELKNLGVKNIMNIEEIEKIINVYLEKKVMILQNDNFNIEYDVERKKFKIETSFSNQEITEKWLYQVNKIYEFITELNLD